MGLTGPQSPPHNQPKGFLTFHSSADQLKLHIDTKPISLEQYYPILFQNRETKDKSLQFVKSECKHYGNFHKRPLLQLQTESK